MALFPKIDSACPLKGDAFNDIQDDYCKHCERSVYNLDHMTDSQRHVFMNELSESVCVSYHVKAKALVSAAAMALALTSGQALADNKIEKQLPEKDIPAAVSEVEEIEQHDPFEEIIIMGSVFNPTDADWQELSEETDIETIPVINLHNEPKDKNSK